MKHCPLCQSAVTRSRPRNWREKLIVWFTSLHPYRCQQCFWRGMMHRERSASTSSFPSNSSSVLLMPEQTRRKKRWFHFYH
ncbi:MAG: hypothetical protein U0Z53_17375 [Blastocatellia bacterium]